MSDDGFRHALTAEMILLAAIILAILVVPSPWKAPLIAAAGIWEATEAFLWMRWSHRRRARVGAEALLGVHAQVVGRLDPVGQVKVNGELWQARSVRGWSVAPGSDVLVLGLEGLTLLVEPAGGERGG
jgi:membrane protein implicated in regulation of membrane protease activity